MTSEVVIKAWKRVKLISYPRSSHMSQPVVVDQMSEINKALTYTTKNPAHDEAHKINGET